MINDTVNIQRRKEILLDAFAGRKIKGLHPNQTPFATLVKKLQESLTRMESFDVITVAQNSDGKPFFIPFEISNPYVLS